LAVIAMLVLVGEVVYYKRKTKDKKEMEISNPPPYPTTIHPFEGFTAPAKKSILLGPGSFVPVENKKPRLSIISVQTRD
jgi:hypothetical protein